MPKRNERPVCRAGPARILVGREAAERRYGYRPDVWCEIEEGTNVVDGDARVVVAAR